MQLYTNARRYQDAIDTTVAIYDQARPDFPSAVVTWFVNALGIAPGTDVLDIYPHTGTKFTSALVAANADVSAVEPGPQMRADLQANFPTVTAYDARAEDLPFADNSFDAVTIAQSAQWLTIDGLQEIQRVLRPGGRFGVIYVRRARTDDMQKGVMDVIRQHTETFNWIEDRWRGTIAASPLFTPGAQNSQPFTFTRNQQQLVDHVKSLGIVACTDAPVQAQIEADIRAFAQAHGNNVPLNYDVVAVTCTRAEGAPLSGFTTESLAMARCVSSLCQVSIY
jgi:ubiquinone/menaquinone biosynthesis C-methylase UbiE